MTDFNAGEFIKQMDEKETQAHNLRIYYDTYNPTNLKTVQNHISRGNEITDALKDLYYQCGMLDGMVVMLDEEKAANINDFIAKREIGYIANRLGADNMSMEILFGRNQNVKYPEYLLHYEQLLKQCSKSELADRKEGEDYRTNQIFTNKTIVRVAIDEYNPTAPEDIETHMKELYDFINYDGLDLDAYLKAGLIYYQYLTILPYEKHNTVRAESLVQNFLCKKRNSKINIPLTKYMEEAKVERDDRMKEVRRSGNYDQWLLFFIRTINEALKSVNNFVKGWQLLRQANHYKLLQQSKMKHTLASLEAFMEKCLIFDISHIAEELGISFNTAAKAVEIFEELDIVALCEGKQRYRKYYYKNMVMELMKV